MADKDPFKLGLAADHGGIELKAFLKARLMADGYEIQDFGADRYDPDDDYPDFVIPLARAVARRSLSRGIAVCGSGVGACVAVNKVPGIRAALINDCYSARQGVEDDDLNLICLGGRVIGPALALDLVQAFLLARFKGSARYRRRLDKLARLESEDLGSGNGRQITATDRAEREENAKW